MLLLLESYGAVPFTKKNHTAAKIISHIYVIFAAMFTFIFFRADNISHAVKYIAHMFTALKGEYLQSSLVFSYMTPYFALVAVMAFLFSTPVIPNLKNKLTEKGHSNINEYCSCAVSIVLFGICVMSVFTSAYNPFIYFRF